MRAAATSIPVQHSHAIHSVETRSAERARPQNLTLLELVAAVGDVTSDEDEIVATVLHMLQTGSVKLTGNFHDESVDEIIADA
jgi:hypothetical protein